jgi:hypothetical protein
MRDGRRRSRPLHPVFLFPFRHRHSLLGHPVPLGNSASFTVGLPERVMRPGPQPGFYTFRTRETRPGWVPSVSRGSGVPPSRATSPAGHVRFSAASPTPRQSFHLRGSKSRDISQGFSRSPVRPSSRPWSPGGAGTLRLSPELSTLPLPATHLGAKTGHTDTDPGLYHRHNRTSFVQPTQLVRPRVAMPPFGHRHWLLRHVAPARGFCLRYLRLTGHHPVTGPCRGFLVPRARDTAGPGALCAPGTVVLSQPASRLRLAPAASASGQSLHPAATLI